MKKVGRPVDISDININEINDWLNSNIDARKIIICQIFISLNNGIRMDEICRVFNVSRESVRIWKQILRNKGLKGLLEDKKRGKHPKLVPEQWQELIKILSKPPKKQGINKNKWNGKILQEFVLNKWKVSINIRTAQTWLAQL